MAYLILENGECTSGSDGYSYYDFDPNDETSLQAIELALSHRGKNCDQTRGYLPELCNTSRNKTGFEQKQLLPKWIRSFLSSLKSTGEETASHQRGSKRLSPPKGPSGRNRKLIFT